MKATNIHSELTNSIYKAVWNIRGFYGGKDPYYCSGLWRCIVWRVCTRVSEEYVASTTIWIDLHRLTGSIWHLMWIHSETATERVQMLTDKVLGRPRGIRSWRTLQMLNKQRMTKAKDSRSSRKSNNVNKNKHELYFRFPAFNKKEEKGGWKRKGGGNKAGYWQKKEWRTRSFEKGERNNKRELWLADIARRRFQNSILPALVLVTSRIKGIEFHWVPQIGELNCFPLFREKRRI